MIILLLFLVYGNIINVSDYINNSPSPAYEIKIVAFKLEPFVKGQKESLAIFECRFKNLSGNPLNNIYNRVYVREENSNAELFYVSPVLRNDIAPGADTCGIIAFRIKNSIEPYSVFYKLDEEEKSESLTKLTADFSAPYMNAEQIAIRLKIKFDREDYSEKSNYESIKQYIEFPDEYFNGLFIKYEILADYRNYTDKISADESSGYYYTSFDLGNREKSFIQKKYIPALKKSGLKYYDEDNYDSSFAYFSKIISADSNFVFNTPEYYDIIYSYSYSTTELWTKDKKGVNIDLAAYYLERISKIQNYTNKCKAFLQLGNIYFLKYNFSGKQDENSRLKSREYYTKILSADNKCRESQQDKAIENLNLLKKQE